MDRLDLNWRPSPRDLRRLLIGGVSVASAAAMLLTAAPALAHDGTPTPLPACSSTLPLTTPCSAPVTTTATGYSIILPGIGTLDITVDPVTNKVTAATVSGLDANFTASAVKIDKDGDSVAVTLTSVSTPTQVYRLKVAVKPNATGAPTVTAKVKGAPKDEDGDEAHEHDGGGSHEVGARGHHGGGGDH
jgi:predicted secreted protein